MSADRPVKPDDPATSDEGFLSRWSRRKREVAQAPTPPVPAPPMPSAESEPDERPRDPETGEVIDEELVRALPEVETLQAGGDLSAFMRRGVPEALRRQALRQMWLTDPAIRDYVSPALDYAHDYNIPGAVHGFGPLSESDIEQARAFLGEVFSTPSAQDRDRPVPDEDRPATESLLAQPGHALPEGSTAEPATGGDKESQALIEEPLLPQTAGSAVRRSDAALQKTPIEDGNPDAAERASAESLATDKQDPAAGATLHRSNSVAASNDGIGQQFPRTAPGRRRGGGAAPV